MCGEAHLAVEPPEVLKSFITTQSPGFRSWSGPDADTKRESFVWPISHLNVFGIFLIIDEEASEDSFWLCFFLQGGSWWRAVAETWSEEQQSEYVFTVIDENKAAHVQVV